MRKYNKLSIESLERREVFSGMLGIEGFDIYDAPLNIEDRVAAEVEESVPTQETAFDRGYLGPYVAQATDEEIIEALNNGTQLTSSVESVTSPRDAASGLATGKRSQILVTKPTDKSTPIILAALQENQTVDGAFHLSSANVDAVFTESDNQDAVVSPRDAASGLPTGQRSVAQGLTDVYYY